VWQVTRKLHDPLRPFYQNRLSSGEGDFFAWLLQTSGEEFATAASLTADGVLFYMQGTTETAGGNVNPGKGS
jgi:hypothetical protein